MSFRLFGVDVEIQIGFWITAVLLGVFSFQRSGFQPILLAIWVAVVLVSVLTHEYGHAFAIKRHRVEPEIALHWMGGSTTWRAILPLRRIDHVVISLAGPFAGFAQAGLIYAFREFAPAQFDALPSQLRLGLTLLESVNFFWGAINLVPVMPFDGGHVLEQALGPKRERLAAMISLGVGVIAAAVFLFVYGSIWGAYIFGSGAFNSYQRLMASSPVRRVDPPARAAAAARDEGPVPPEAVGVLKRAREALADEQLGQAEELAEQVLRMAEQEPASDGWRHASRKALEVLAWAHVLRKQLDRAEYALERAKRLGPVDPALVSAVLKARGNMKEARKVLESARTAGDDRKEIVGPLIQILLEQGEVARAAAVALDVVDSLSEEDARRMAELAFEGGAFEWSARLHEAVFAREGQAEDAYAAARAHARSGEPDRALELLRRAVQAGFSDRARAWSDAALESLRGANGLETVLPRP